MEPLRKKAEFSRVYRLGKSARAAEFSIKALKSNEQTLKVAIVVPKKVSKLAVSRNKIRRRIRETIRKNLALATPGYFVIVNVYADISLLSYTELEKKLIISLTKLQVFSNK